MDGKRISIESRRAQGGRVLGLSVDDEAVRAELLLPVEMMKQKVIRVALGVDEGLHGRPNEAIAQSIQRTLRQVGTGRRLRTSHNSDSDGEALIANPHKRYRFAPGQAQELHLVGEHLRLANRIINYRDARDIEERDGARVLPVDFDEVGGGYLRGGARAEHGRERENNQR